MNQNIDVSSLGCDVSLAIKREDLLHPIISGNKYRKLKYTIAHVLEISQKCMLTFGGAYSNHIAAVAAAGKLNNIKTIGIIRGEELAGLYMQNPTLRFAQEQGMLLVFVSRAQYALKETPAFLKTLHDNYGDFYTVPEGGTNDLAIKGCAEILTPKDDQYDYICLCTGTGGTLAGVVSSLKEHQKAIGFSALKGTFQDQVVSKYTSNTNYSITDAYCFGGYAKVDITLIDFINTFKQIHGIGLDPVYTGKLLYGVFDLIKKDYFSKNSRILALHTGGMQGVAGMNLKLEKMNLPQINV
jgi:1-aminocyclopropane-1-carboxylate deaminase